MKITNSIVIAAPAERVWQLTTDVANWPAITPTMQRVERLDEGPFGLGSTARIKQPGQTPAVWTVTRFDAGHEFAWQTTRMGVIMTGSHRVERDGDQTRNTLGLDMTGRGAGLMGLLFGGIMRKALQTENNGFKTSAEQAA
jgi:uncharacterized membrane protein